MEDGWQVGWQVGCDDGWRVGKVDGCSDGCIEGIVVGCPDIVTVEIGSDNCKEDNNKNGEDKELQMC